MPDPRKSLTQVVEAYRKLGEPLPAEKPVEQKPTEQKPSVQPTQSQPKR
jgi:hypothetical protein